MGCDPATIKDALAAQIRDRVARDVTVYAWDESSPDYDCVLIYEAESDPLDYFGSLGLDGMATLALVVEVVVSAGDAETRSRRLDEFASIGVGKASSIPDAVMFDDASLGLAGVSATCLAMTSKITTDEAGHGRATWPVQITFLKDG